MGEEPVTYREAIRAALRDALTEDDRVVLLGEDIAVAGGAFKVTDGLFEEFGARVMDTPISEMGFVGAAVGLAVAGYRPVVELMFADFAAVAFDQIVNQAAKYRYLSAGQMGVPLVIRAVGGAGLGFASQHSQTTESWYLSCPGLKVVVAGTPQDAYGLLLEAVRDPDPVIYIEHKALYNERGVGRLDRVGTRLGSAVVCGAGHDVTVVASLAMVREAMRARDIARESGVSLEVIDLRSLVPMDVDTVLQSVERTGRLLVVQEEPTEGGWAGSLVARVCDRGFDLLDVAPRCLGGAWAPTPYSRQLELASVPDAERLAALAIEQTGGLSE